jgi:hypothetical protein
VWFPPVRNAIGFPEKPAVWEFAAVGALFLCLVLSIFAVKPFLYDVFAVAKGNEIRIRGGHPQFQQGLIDANPGNSMPI